MKNSAKATLGAAAATGAAMATAYYLYGSESAALHRKKAKTWVKKAEREILQQAKRIKNSALTDETLKGVITSIAKRYQTTKSIAPKEIREFIGSIQKGFREARSSVTRKATAARAKVVKKASGIRRRARKVRA